MQTRCSKAMRALIVTMLVVACSASARESAYADPSVEAFRADLDMGHGGLKGVGRSLDESAGELAILLGRRGDREAQEWIKRTLEEAMALQDSERGGFYTASLGSTWNKPQRHERALYVQATAIRLYTLGYLLFNDDELLETAQHAQGFVEKYLKVRGGRYAAAQRGEGAGGALSLDETFSRTAHAALLKALSALYAASGNDEYLAQAVLIAEESLVGMGDSSSFAELIAATDAYLSLYAVSAQGRWLELAQGAFKVLQKRLAQRERQDLEMVLRYVRVAASLGGYEGDVSVSKEAKALLDANTLPMNATASLQALYRLTHCEVDSAASHLMTVGERDSFQARKLWGETLAVIPLHLQREWVDLRDEPLSKRTLSYPRVAKPAVFVCSKGRCSLPLFTEQEVRETIAQVIP